MARGGKGRSGRRYVRDNRGRFASKGAGATARGGRLKTASGKKRATQMMKVSGAKAAGTISKPKGLKLGTIKTKPQTSSARQAATDRLKIKTQTRRKLKTDRSSVIPTQPRAQRLQSSRPASTVAKKPRAKGNNPATVARRIDRKAAVNQANIRNITQKERTGATQGRQYQRALKTQATLKRAQEFTKTGKLPGRDNSIKAQRERKAASQRLAAKNAERKAARQRGDTASVNVPMSGSRGRRLNAEISRNVKQQQTAKRAESRARNAKFKSDQSRAKALRTTHVGAIAKAKGLSKGQVESALKAQPPSVQIKALKNWVRDNRKGAPKAAKRRR